MEKEKSATTKKATAKKAVEAPKRIPRKQKKLNKKA